MTTRPLPLVIRGLRDAWPTVPFDGFAFLASEVAGGPEAAKGREVFVHLSTQDVARLLMSLPAQVLDAGALEALAAVVGVLDRLGTVEVGQ